MVVGRHPLSPAPRDFLPTPLWSCLGLALCLVTIPSECCFPGGCPGGAVVKNPPADTDVEEEMATHSVSLPGKSHRERSPAG